MGCAYLLIVVNSFVFHVMPISRIIIAHLLLLDASVRWFIIEAKTS